MRKFYICIALSFFAFSTVYALDFPRILPDPAISEIASGKIPFAADRFMTNALLLSGADSPAMREAISRLNALMDAIQAKIPFGKSDYETGKAILEFLHDQVFSRYSELQTRLDMLLDNGIYNCVSSAILYMFFAKLYNLEVRGSATADHAFCSIIINKETIDIETTSKYGFDPGKTLEFHDNFGNTTGFAYIPPSDYKNRFIPTEIDMLSYILQNRIVALQREHRYDLTVPLAVDRYFLLNSPGSLEEMHLEFQNYISYLNSKKMYHDGLAFIRHVTDEYNNINRYQESSDVLVHNLAVLAINAGQTGRAQEIVAEYSNLLSSDELLRLKNLISQKTISLLLYNEEYDKAGIAIVDAYKTPLFRRRNTAALSPFSIQTLQSDYLKRKGTLRLIFIYLKESDSSVKLLN
ncbi:MAG: hypothetical protein JW874_11340 [Spirochaetales bacterium]|nr:hypothetical protein [Spirochaetales bacterium]